MPYEVELKFAHEPDSNLESMLLDMGAVVGTIEHQVDIYFQHPSRDFSQTDEAMRIRSVGEKNVLTFKGPLVDSETKTRIEQEVDFESGDSGRETMCRILESNGYRKVICVEKRRQSYRLNAQGREFEVAFDQVKNLGEYIEIETVAEESERAEATEKIRQLAEDLGLVRQERRGYLRLLLEHQASES